MHRKSITHLAQLSLALGIAASTVAFVRAPFPQWIAGNVADVNPAQTKLTIREHNSTNLITFEWNQETRQWIEPVATRAPGAPLQPEKLTTNRGVRVMYKDYSSRRLATRIIFPTDSK